MRRYVPILIAGTVLIAAACSDATAPKQSTSKMQQFNGASAAKLVLGDLTSGTYTFTLDPRGGSTKFGAFRLNYDANAVCDPSTSGYGDAYWLAPCSTLKTAITITAKVNFVDGESTVEFSPDIRFSPNAMVILGAKRSALKGLFLTNDVKNAYSILFFRTVNGSRQFVDEAATDSELGTKYDNSNGWVSRRVRHFSGYYVRSGKACDESDCGGDTGLNDVSVAIIQ
jgi:hypothetical protein